MAIFCCGPPPDLLAVDVALAARRARGVVLLLDDDSAQPAAPGCALRTAAAAAADMLPPITRVLWHRNATSARQSRTEPVAVMLAPSQAGDDAADAPLAGSGRVMHGQQPDMRLLPQPAVSRGAALRAVRAAVEGLLGVVPADDAPLMDAGLASAGAVQLVDALSDVTGRDLPGMPRRQIAGFSREPRGSVSSRERTSMGVVPCRSHTHVRLPDHRADCGLAGGTAGASAA